MTVRTTSSVIVKTRDGQTVVLDEREKVVTETFANCVCDGPKCAARHGLDAPRSFSFQVEKVKEDPAAMPEIADTFIPIIIPERSPTFDGQNHSACSIQCFKDWLQYTYVPAPPRWAGTDVQIPDKFGVSSEGNFGVGSALPEEFPASVDKNEELLVELGRGFVEGEPEALKPIKDYPGVYEYGKDYAVASVVGSPSAEDLDAVAREAELATATVSDPTGYSGHESD